MPEIKYPDCHPFIVDDDQDFTLLIRRTLERVGVPHLQIRSCGDGEKAVSLLSEDGWIPSFVMLDLHMPKRSGLEVLEWIRSAPSSLASVPVFMLTSSSQHDHVARAFELGIGSYFIKPVGIHALQGILQGIVEYWKAVHRPALIQGSLEPGAL